MTLLKALGRATAAANYARAQMVEAEQRLIGIVAEVAASETDFHKKRMAHIQLAVMLAERADPGFFGHPCWPRPGSPADPETVKRGRPMTFFVSDPRAPHSERTG